MIGDSYACISKSKIGKFLTKKIGTPDLHTHFRMAPLRKFIKEGGLKNANKLIEVGCGNGANLFEIAKLNQSMNFEGYDIDSDVINIGEVVAKCINLDKQIKFFCKNIIESDFTLESEKYDVVLYCDILEHIIDEIPIINKMDISLKKNGIAIVSVPTKLYPKIFGKKFHEKIGHVRNGYNLNEIISIFPKNYSLKYYKYNTGIIASIFCYLFYRFIIKIKLKFFQNTLEIAFQISRPFDYFNGENVSSSIFIVMEKQ